MYLHQSLRAFCRRLISSNRIVFIMLLFAFRSSIAATPLTVPMQSDHWITNGNAVFTDDEHQSSRVLDVSKGLVTVKDLIFSDGTIEFDMYMPDHGILGMRLRAQDRDNAEAVYFRPQKECATSPDCMQYMPLEHGAFEWDLFPEYQAPAPLRLLDWNHLRVVVKGRSLQVFVNHSAIPTLNVDHMEGKALSGSLMFAGTAKYANLVITPAPSATAPAPAPGAMTAADGFLRHWQISAASVLPSTLDPALNAPMGVQPAIASMPLDGDTWRHVTAQNKGLVNFSHEIGSAKDASVISMAWAKTTLVSEKAQSKTVQIGFVREVWVYVNGTLAFSGRNVDGLPAGNVDGQRISLNNGTFQLNLKKGNNEIAIALDDNLPGNSQHFGWGMQVKLRDLTGLLPQ
jgi:hypothetical protein